MLSVIAETNRSDERSSASRALAVVTSHMIASAPV